MIIAHILSCSVLPRSYVSVLLVLADLGHHLSEHRGSVSHILPFGRKRPRALLCILAWVWKGRWLAIACVYKCTCSFSRMQSKRGGLDPLGNRKVYMSGVHYISDPSDDTDHVRLVSYLNCEAGEVKDALISLGYEPVELIRCRGTTEYSRPDGTKVDVVSRQSPDQELMLVMKCQASPFNRESWKKTASRYRELTGHVAGGRFKEDAEAVYGAASQLTEIPEVEELSGPLLFGMTLSKVLEKLRLDACKE